MKCISLWQPWASLVAIGAKRIETRSWLTSYRGPLAIHAAKYYSMETAKFAATEPCHSALRATGLQWGHLPRGGIIAVCNLLDVVKINGEHVPLLSPAPHERDFGDWGPGRFAWMLNDILSLKQMIPLRAHQKLFNLDNDVIAQVWRAAA
jgi:activating signal cointegrator 1